MVRRLDSASPDFAEAFEELIFSKRTQDADVDAAVSAIIEEVRTGGDKALIALSKRFDDVDLGQTELRVERDEIERHVEHTFDFLATIPWTPDLQNIPWLARSHHEKLDGSGYPLGLVADQIPAQSRIMTIADIFDALVAWDRPYKKAVPVERALDILGYEAEAGKLDQALLDVFIESKVFELGLRQRQSSVG